jgi:hypothetical protein
VAPPTHSIVGQGRVELPTSRLSGVRSNHLSYWPGQLTRGRRRAGCADFRVLFRGGAELVALRSLETEPYAALLRVGFDCLRLYKTAEIG